MEFLKYPQFRIVLYYLIAGSLWILLSDYVSLVVFHETEAFIIIQTIKGSMFIVITAILLFFLVRSQFHKLHQAYEEVVTSYDKTIQGWIRVMDHHNSETSDHTSRVTDMTVAFARHCGISDPEELKAIERGAILHDLGKIGIPDTILTKPGKLDAAEFEIIKQHPRIARDVLEGIPFLQSSLDIPYSHHEKYDGSGYPQGLKGEEIPLSARLFAIVDVWDALSHNRVYKAAWENDTVFAYLQEHAGTHFDAELVTLFIDNFEAIYQEADTRKNPA